jgi:hypothetical protein
MLLYVISYVTHGMIVSVTLLEFVYELKVHGFSEPTGNFLHTPCTSGCLVFYGGFLARPVRSLCPKGYLLDCVSDPDLRA